MIKTLKNKIYNDALLLVRMFCYVKKCTSLFLNGVLSINQELSSVFAVNFAWVIGGGLLQQNDVATFVNHPSPLTHESINWRCSSGY